MALSQNGLPLLMAGNTPQLALFAEVRIGSGSGQIVNLGVSGGAGSVQDQGALSNTSRSTEE